jgi:glycosyltransferase involved in cell wall biosynthesis
MIFSFLKYLAPCWYYNLKPSFDHQYFSSKPEVSYSLDGDYESVIAKQRDLAWLMFKQGEISLNNSNVGINIWQPEQIPIGDEYTFIHKYFSPVWCWYILCLRLLSLKNPLKEINAFQKSRRKSVKKYDFARAECLSKKVAQVELTDSPYISIIIPTLNRYEYLKDVLRDLEDQTFKKFEVIVIDQSEPFNADFYKGWALSLVVEHQEEKALWMARNNAIRMSKGDIILLYDDDSRVEKNWIEQHLKCLKYFNADISSGVSVSDLGMNGLDSYRIFKWADQLDTGNVMLKKDVFKKIGLFDRQFEKQRMGDGEFGLRAYLAGFKNINNPLAERLHLKAEQGGLRQMGSWDEFRPKKIFAPRPIPSVLYLYRKYYGTKMTLFAVANSLPKSIVPYKFKKNKKMLLLGSIISVVFIPFLIMQVIWSWNIAGRMLKEGAKIETL